ncbi:MAG TPA: ATP-binding protein, partial [Prosthecobacter sp.]|nr:ATP-binding protein [Prosthecobacter sp.]
LDISRIAAGKMPLSIESIDVNAKVNAVCIICGPNARDKGIEVLTHLDPNLPRIAGDAARVQQILWNLLSNAIKFTPPRGRVTISTQQLNPEQIQLQVHDTGTGIDPAVLPGIFDAFQQGSDTVTQNFGGLGLGLAITKALVQCHGGVIEASSGGKGTGALFTVTLPVGTAPTVPSPASPTDEFAPHPSPLRLLMVEDHHDTAHTMAALLERSGFIVRTAGNVADALKVLATEPLDVLVSDLGLPDGTGYDLVRTLRKTSSLPAIAMSGYGMQEDLLIGARKPVSTSIWSSLSGSAC